MTVTIKDILSVLDNAKACGDLSVSLTGVSHDSRRIKPGYLFVAIPGAKADGHEFVRSALSAGAAAVLAQIEPGTGILRHPLDNRFGHSKSPGADIFDHLPSAHGMGGSGWNNRN